MGIRNARSCSACGGQLAADNKGALCSPCSHSAGQEREGEAKGEEFWQRPALVEALQSRHFGRVLYAYRYEHRPVLTQATVAQRLNMTQAQISRLERGERPPSDLDKLAAWAETLRIPEAALWFRLPERTHPPVLSTHGFGWFGGRRSPSLVSASARPLVAVDSIRDTTTMFRQLDNRFGGGHARDMVSSYLSSEIAPALRERHPIASQCEFVVAVAELNQLAGWMAYDVGDTLSGRRHLQQAFQMCQSVGDRALSAEMLAGMSHQAAHAGEGAVSVGLARAARDSAAETGLAALQSETAVMEAHGLAVLRDKPGSVIALRDAEKAFSRAEHEPRPPWLGYYDTAYLSAKMAHCMRELGDLGQAERFARRSLEMSAGYDRGKLFNTALLASILADRRKIDEACAVGGEALRLTESLQSARTLAYLQDFAVRIRRHRATPAVVELDQRLQVLGV